MASAIQASTMKVPVELMFIVFLKSCLISPPNV